MGRSHIGVRTIAVRPPYEVRPTTARCRSDLLRQRSGEGIDALGERIELEFERTLRPVELLLPYSEGGRLAELHDVGGELDREDTSEGVRVRVRLPATVAERFAPYVVSANGAGRNGH